MKILFFALGPEIIPSSRTRVFQYLPALKKLGAKCSVITYKSGIMHRIARFKGNNSLLTKGLHKCLEYIIHLFDSLFGIMRIVQLLAMAPRYDVIIVQKVILSVIMQEFLRRLNDCIVFDYDDALFAWPHIFNKASFEHQLAISKLITIENAYTEAYSARFNSRILRITGPIDVHRYVPRSGITQKKEKVVLGWIGSVGAVKYLKPLEGVLRDLIEKFSNLEVNLVGVPGASIAGARVLAKAWHLDEEVYDLQNFDIGIMPLFDDEWERGKGGYKLLQYMAIGIPGVASPVGINCELIQEGKNGFLASGEKEWTDKLSFLIENPEARAQMGANGRRLVEEKYSFEVATPRLYDALAALIGQNVSRIC